MKLPGFLRKPRWLSKDAATRRAAVEHDRDAELVAGLGRLAREDEDAGVRLAALRRLADPGIAQGVARDDADAEVRAQARALWLALLTGTHPSAPTLAERERLLKAQDEDELIEHVTRHAREPSLRGAALERVRRPALLLERAIEDADPALRLAAAARIDDEAQLARLAERSRRSDKQVNRLARERIETLRLARGDAEALTQRARALCERLEQLLREPAGVEAEDEVAQRWNEIEARVDEALRTRYAAARALLGTSRLPPPSATETAPAEPSATTEGDGTAMPSDAEPPAADAVETAPEVEIAPAGDPAIVAPLLAQARFSASLDEANAQRKQERERQRAALAELGAAVDAFAAAVESGASADAHVARTRIDELRKRIDGALPKELAQRLAAAGANHAEISRWQHWADEQRRQQLCEEIEALPASGLHPDAIATRVRDAQQEWSRLDAAAAGGRPSGLGRRFHAACRAALAPAQAYFRKRHELRETHAQAVAELLARADAAGADAQDPNADAALRRELADALRGLDRIEPRERKALADRLKAALGAIDERIAQQRAQVAEAKAALIAEAQALGRELPRGAVAASRELQQRWQQAGRGARSRDEAQWKEFRAAIDAVFARLDSERAERGARDQAAQAQAESLCAEIEALSQSAAPDRAATARLESAWSALGSRDEALRQRFAAAQGRLREADARRRRALRQARFEGWLSRDAICRAAEARRETADALRERWTSAPATDIGADALAARFESALGTQPAATDDDAARDVLIELDLLAGLDSPPAERERRRELQLERLSARMRGGSAAAPYDDLAELLARRSALVLGDDAGARFERGVRALLATLD